MNISPPRFCPVAQLLAAGEYAKHGWKSLDRDLETFRDDVKQEVDSNLDETYALVVGKVTAGEIADKMNVGESCARRRLNSLVSLGRITRVRQHVSGKPNCVKEFEYFRK